MPVLPVVLFLLVFLAGSLPAFSYEDESVKICCYPATFSPSPYPPEGCVCALFFNPYYYGSFFVYLLFSGHVDACSEYIASQDRRCGDVSFTCVISSQGNDDDFISCSSFSSSGYNPFPSSFSCPLYYCIFDDSVVSDFDLGFGSGLVPGSGLGSGFACQSVNNLIDTFQGVKEGFLRVFIGSAFAFGLLGGAYAVLRVVF
jgi:hypothetical protein